MPLSATRPKAGIMWYRLFARPLGENSYIVQALAGVVKQAAASASPTHRPGALVWQGMAAGCSHTESMNARAEKPLGTRLFLKRKRVNPV